MRIEEKVMTQWGCSFCCDLLSETQAFEFLIGPHDEKGHILICDRCVALCNEEITQWKATQPSEPENAPKLLHVP